LPEKACIANIIWSFGNIYLNFLIKQQTSSKSEDIDSFEERLRQKRLTYATITVIDSI
jgi:hypothetical protein